MKVLLLLAFLGACSASYYESSRVYQPYQYGVYNTGFYPYNYYNSHYGYQPVGVSQGVNYGIGHQDQVYPYGIGSSYLSNYILRRQYEQGGYYYPSYNQGYQGYSVHPDYNQGYRYGVVPQNVFYAY